MSTRAQRGLNADLGQSCGSWWMGQVVVGAHAGCHDLVGFGRRFIEASRVEIRSFA